MRKLALCLCGAILLIGCGSHSTSGIVGTWKSSRMVVVFKGDKTWNVVGINMDSGTWDQSGSTVTMLPIKIQGKTRQEYTTKTKGDMGKELEALQQIEKAFSPFKLTLDEAETSMKDPSNIVGDLKRQAS